MTDPGISCSTNGPETETDDPIGKRDTTNDPKRPQFGNRRLMDKDKVFEHNAWDNVDWDDDLLEEARRKVAVNSETLMDKEKRERLERDAADQWDVFYGIHDNRFFKDRNWLFTEFPELGQEPYEVNSETESSSRVSILEVGCGAGNTVFPILATNPSQSLFVYCCDFSQVAVDIVKNHEAYDQNRCHAFRWDLTNVDAEVPVIDDSVDFITMLFVLSAIDPAHFPAVIQRLARLLKPGGKILFRDYGRYDMAQLRFKPGSAISENFYARGDGTRVYFFTQEEAHNLFLEAGLIEDFNQCDKRLQVNRGRQIKMYRVWLQCKFRKPHVNH